jgi:hypothetical protein
MGIPSGVIKRCLMENHPLVGNFPIQNGYIYIYEYVWGTSQLAMFDYRKVQGLT